jgi:hypothetical protein
MTRSILRHSLASSERQGVYYIVGYVGVDKQLINVDICHLMTSYPPIGGYLVILLRCLAHLSVNNMGQGHPGECSLERSD